MLTEVKPDLQLEIGHVLFIDVVGYSKLLIDDQRDRQNQLNEVVRNAQEFRAAEAEGKLVSLPTGDGMALVFFTKTEAPLRCALQISDSLRSHPQLRLRMGINTGAVSGTVDVNGRGNIAGAGINIAKRVMDCGDAGHILISKRTAEDLAQYRHWHRHLYDLGECEVKHGEVLPIVNLYTGEQGNPEVPQKLREKSGDVRKFFTRRVLVLAGLIGLGAAGAIAFLTFRQSPSLVGERSIAVLPFGNLSDDHENAYFADGIQDDVLMNLAKIGDLRVVSRTSVMKYAAQPTSVREIGKALGVATVLEGTVRRVQNRVKVNVQLIKAANDEHLWAEEYDRELTDVFALQSDLALKIASALQTELSPQEKARVQRRPTTSGEAYLFYLRAQSGLARARSDEDLERIAALYMEAIRLDSSFALALARLSYVLSTLYQGSGDLSFLEKAQTAATEALRLQPDLPEAHLALGYVYYRGNADYERALRELAIAKAGLPNDEDILLVAGSIERRQGKWAQSTADLEKAASVNPPSVFLWTNLALNYQAMREYSAAAKAFAKGTTADSTSFMNECLSARLRIDWKGDTGPMERLLSTMLDRPDPDGRIALARFQLKVLQRKFDEALSGIAQSNSESFLGFRASTPFPKSFLLGRAYQFLNETTKAQSSYEEARQAAEMTAVQNSTDPWRAALLGQIYAGLGRKEDAIREGRRAVELLPETKDAFDGPALTLTLAEIYALVGDGDSAVSLLEHSLASPAGVTIHALRLDPVWDSLRSHPRFEKLMSSSAVEGKR